MVSQEPLANARILIVDDEPDVLRLCEVVLQAAGYSNIITTPDPRGVLTHFVEHAPDILLLDISMPHLDGFQLLSVLHKSQQIAGLPVLVMTALATPEKRQQALRAGAVDMVTKPFDSQELVLRITNLLRLRMAVREMQEQNSALFSELLNRTEELSSYQLELKEAQLEVIARLARAGERRDDDTGHHTQRVAATAGLLAQQMGASPEEAHIIQQASPLHDVGKIGVPDSILLKPGRLSREEFRVMQRHCQIGADLLAGGRSEIVQAAECIALTHHERWNGGGYPRELEAAQIPLPGRIVAVADVFDALTHGRPYKDAWSIDETLAEIRRQAGRQFDPEVVEAFLELPHAELV